MNESAIAAVISAAVIASLGLWWFRLIMTAVRKQAKATRYGVYAAVWLAYFILTMVVIGQTQQ